MKMRQTKGYQQFTHSQRHALDTRRNLVVRANAGTGKTSVLVERIVQILAESWDTKEPLVLTQILAITFTRKAAAELEERLRYTFRDMAEKADPGERAFWAARAEELPRAMIGTIDSFCARVLREFGLEDSSEDRIESDFSPLEGFEESVLKKEAIDRLIDELSSGVRNNSGSFPRSEHIEACQWWAEHEGYHTLTHHLMNLLDHTIEPRMIVAAHAQLPSPEDRVRAAWENLPAVRELRSSRETLTQECLRIVHEIKKTRKPNASLQSLGHQLSQVLDLLQSSDPQGPRQVLEKLQQAILTDEGKPRKRGLDAIQSQLTPLQEKWGSMLGSFEFDFDGEVRALEAADKLALLLEPAYAQYLALCREANQYDFTSIARHTHDLLTRSPHIRRNLRDQYRYVLVDEFQDTNQLQWEIISWIVGEGPAEPLDRDRLFIVGDPQQSIYRFRRADVGVFARVQQVIHQSNQRQGLGRIPTTYDDLQQECPSGSDQRLGFVPLQENHRTLKKIPLLLMDRVFQYAFESAANNGDGYRDPLQIEYQRLLPGFVSEEVGEVRYVIPELPATDSLDEDEESGTEDLVGRQVQGVLDQLQSLFGQRKYIVRGEEASTLGWKDMAILLPSRNVVLSQLEKELVRRGIPFVVTSGIGFWQRQEIRDVISLASCLSDSGDELALFAVLRGPIGQLSDKEILFLSHLGRGRILKGLQECHGEPGAIVIGGATQSEQLRSALTQFWEEMNDEDRQRLRSISTKLDDWRQRVDRMAHSDLLQRCLEESGAYALYAAEPDGELVMANLRRLFERIRAEESRSIPGLGRVARWMRVQVDDSEKEEQANLAPDLEAVQIMTIHAAKGLEFPVVAVMKMERKVKRSQSQRLLVKSEWDRLLRDDEEELGEIQPGTLTVAVRHPARPRELYPPRLLSALRKLEQAQDLAESRRLFYVAATRAKERLILAGKQPKQKKDGGAFKLPESWQKWFEESLGIAEEHKQKGVWEDPSNQFKISIITNVAPSTERKEELAHPISPTIDLQYLHERSRSPSIATTGLEKMRETFHQSPRDWWLKYRVKVLPRMPKPNPKSDIRNPKSEHGLFEFGSEDGEENFGTVIGTLVHRLFEMGLEGVGKSLENRRPLLHAMAVNLLTGSQIQKNGDTEEEVDSISQKMASFVVSQVEHIIDKIDIKEYEEIRRLLELPGRSEVEFLLPLGGWLITGRFDKLILHPSGGYEVVDWKTDREDDWQNIVDRYVAQMRLYALALYRCGRAALVDGKVCVHLALLHNGRVEVLGFPLESLEEHALMLEEELQKMDEFGEASALPIHRDRG